MRWATILRSSISLFGVATVPAVLTIALWHVIDKTGLGFVGIGLCVIVGELLFFCLPIDPMIVVVIIVVLFVPIFFETILLALYFGCLLFGFCVDG